MRRGRNLRAAVSSFCLAFAMPAFAQTTFPDTRSGPFYRHIVSAPQRSSGCTMTINGQPAPLSTQIIIESQSPVIPFMLTCSFLSSGVTVTSQTVGSITMDFPAEIPPNAVRGSFSYTLPPGSLRTRASVAAVYTPGVSINPTSTYDAVLTVAHGNRASGAFGNCDTQTQERRSVPKGAINVGLATTCDNQYIFENTVTPPHGFGTPSRQNRSVSNLYH